MQDMFFCLLVCFLERVEMVTVTRINLKSPSTVGRSRRHGCAEPTGTAEVDGQAGRFIGWVIVSDEGSLQK